MQRSKYINDPIFGFIEIPQGLLYKIVTHPYMQRLSRIKQLGVTSVAYPGAQHTRFLHSVGAYFLMCEAIEQLQKKGHDISPAEAEATKAAILLHDVGHGPFSHVLEKTIIPSINHECLSLMLMKRINKETYGALDLSIDIFTNKYEKHFLHQLISGQLDMDRLDYLRRDSFFTGVKEGNIGSERIIKMLDVRDDQLVVNEKGIYSIENFLIARRLMYWQVYLHKTSVACERMLISALRRAKELMLFGENIYCPPILSFFFTNDISKERFTEDESVLDQFVLLDDNDIWTALKTWSYSKDRILVTLCQGIINRNLFKIELSDTEFDKNKVDDIAKTVAKQLSLSEQEVKYFVSSGTIENKTYNPYNDTINLLLDNQEVINISQKSDILNVSALNRNSKKYYLSYYRGDELL